MDILIDDIDAILARSSSLSDEEVKKGLMLVVELVKTGNGDAARKAKEALEQFKKAKKLDWKKNVAVAKEIFDVVGKLPASRMKPKDAVGDYTDFVKKFLDFLKKGKVLPQLQSDLVTFFFNCIESGTPAKAEMISECSGRDFMDISKEPTLRQTVLEKYKNLLLKKNLPMDNRDINWGMENIIQRLVESYEDNGKKVTEAENQLFLSIFKFVSEGSDSITQQFYQEDNENIPNMYFRIWRDGLIGYINVHRSSRTLGCITPIMPDIIKWARIAVEEEDDNMEHGMFVMLQHAGLAPPEEFKDILPEIIDFMLETEKFQELHSFVGGLYPHNPKAVHDRLQDLLDSMANIKDMARHQVSWIFHTVAQAHPEVFKRSHIESMFKLYQGGLQQEQMLLLMVVRSISEKHPSHLVDCLPQLCDDSIFKPDSLNLRTGIIACIGGVNKKLGEEAVAYLMKYADYSDGTVSHIVVGQLSTMVRKHQDFMQKYKPKLEKLEQSSPMPQVKDLAHDMILVLEGKSVENIAEDVQQQQEDIADLDEKVDATIGTVITIGDKVIEHDKEIGELGEQLEQVEERVDDVEEDLGETKIKVEEIDNKTMSNAPKWSRDLTKLMNPTADNDWRLLASRLGYSNDDIRGWATQHDPCMALLSEWYATHKTSEASYGVLTALTEMNRMDGVAIVENAMKAAEDVVEDEEFEYPSPPPIFISYQWGFQNEVKLLKHHLNMAGYECWLDVGQMGGGDKLFAKIDNGIRGAKVVICCTTEKYAQSPNCNREVNLSVNLNKPIIPLLMEKMDWPPKGSMGPIFSEYLFIRFFQRCGEETAEKDQRYWPIPKFQELLMQLNFFVVPDPKAVTKEYSNWWAPMVEDIVIDKNKGKNQKASEKTKENNNQVVAADQSPVLFLSYQWGKQPQVKALFQRLSSMGYTVWMDIYQMGGGDSLYDKIDRGMRGCKAVVSCVTKKYSLSANCRREVSLADALKKPIIPLLLEEMKWPPDGPMSMVFTELLYINFHRDATVQMQWQGEQFDELVGKLGQFIPKVGLSAQSKDGKKSTSVKSSGNTSTDTVSQNKQRKGADSATGQRATAENKRPSSVRKDDMNGNSKGPSSGQKSIGSGNEDDKNSNASTKRAVTKAASVKAISNDMKTGKTIQKNTGTVQKSSDLSDMDVAPALKSNSNGTSRITERKVVAVYDERNLSQNKTTHTGGNENLGGSNPKKESEEREAAKAYQNQGNVDKTEPKSKSCIIL